MAFCSQCGAKNVDGAKFCGTCGAALAPTAGQTAPSAEPKWKTAPTGQPAGQAAPTAQPPWTDPSWQQAAPTGQPTWQSTPTAGPAWNAAPTAQQPWAGQRSPGMTQAKEARGWVGIIGAIVVIIGMFLPLISVYGIKVSFFDSVFGDYSEFMDSTSMMISIAAIGLAIVCGVLYLLSKNQIGGILSVVGVVAYILAVFGTETSNYEYVMELVSTGFWVMLAGYIVMALSAVLKSVNASIDAAFGGNKR